MDICFLFSIGREGADLEPFSFEESLRNQDDFPFWDKDQSKQIFPFAQTGAGDWYGFCFSMKSETSLPIVLMSHDSEIEEIYVKETAFTRYEMNAVDSLTCFC